MTKRLRRQAQHAGGLNATSRAFVSKRKLVILHGALLGLMTRRPHPSMCRECGACAALGWEMAGAPGQWGRWPSMTTADKLAILDWGRRPTAPPSALIFVSRVRDAENNALGSAVSRRPQFNITSFRFKTKARDAERGAPWSDYQETPSEHVPRMRSTYCAGLGDGRSARPTGQMAANGHRRWDLRGCWC